MLNSVPRNCDMTLNVDCCELVAFSPAPCASPPGVSVPNTAGMPPVELKKLVSAPPTALWLPFSPEDGTAKLIARSRNTLLVS